MATSPTLDSAKFYAIMNQEGLAKPNMYRVIFGSLRNVLNNIGESSTNYYTIEDIAALSNGVTTSQTSLYEELLSGSIGDAVSVTTSSLLMAGQSSVSNIGLLAKNCNLPSNSLTTNPNRQAKRYRQNEVSNRTHAPMRMTFYCTASRDEWLIFKLWMQYIYNDSTAEVAFPNKYYCTTYIYSYDSYGVGRSMTQYSKVFPINIGSVEMGYENGNQILTFDVEFEYSKEETLSL